MEWETIHPAINACLNALSAVFLLRGYLAIRGGNRDAHKRFMISAFSSSTVFLISYLIRFAMSGTHRYPGEGWSKVLYLVILFSHMVLAVILVPLVLRTLYLAHHRRFADHKRIVKYTWPIWMYVSITGVVVYFMLYH
jgi:putative membrane protein